MAEIRETQLVTEAVQNAQSFIRATQTSVESVHNSFAYIRGTQLVVEVLCDVDYFSVMSYDSIGEMIFGSVIIR